MPSKKDYTGMKFGLLTALHPNGKSDGKIVWRFVCDCGNEVDKVVAWVSRKGCHGIPSCGCLTKQLFRNRFKKAVRNHDHPLYKTWLSMRTRCLNPKCAAWKFYGAKGITVCDRWNSFRCFVDDMYPSWEKGKTMDRIDGTKGYSPENCRWSTPAEQARNTCRNIRIGGKLLIDIADEKGINRSTIYSRYRNGVRGEALFAPAK